MFDVLYVDGVDPLATPLEEPVATLAEIASQLRIPSVFISEGTRLRPDKVAAETDTVDDLPSDEFRRSHRSSPLNPTELGDPMFSDSKAFSSFSVDDLERAKDFYGETLGLEVVETPEGLELRLAGGTSVFVYPSTNYTPPKHTILNFPVEDVEAAVDELARRGVVMEQYDLPEIKTDEKGIFRGSSGPARLRGSRIRPATCSRCLSWMVARARPPVARRSTTRPPPKCSRGYATADVADLRA